jgi:hypothetical protein
MQSIKKLPESNYIWNILRHPNLVNKKLYMICKTLRVALLALLVLQFGCGRQNTSTGSSTSSSERRYPNLKSQADQFNQASLTGDDDKVIELTYPKLIELMGGREEFLANADAIRSEMESQQLRVLSATAEDPKDIIEVNNQIYAIVPVRIRIKGPEGVLAGRSFTIGVSEDRGENWKFVSAGSGQLDAEQLKLLFPAAAEKLDIPEDEEPTLEGASASPSP